MFQFVIKVNLPRYMNPEVKLGESYNETVNLYALGRLYYNLLKLKRPYMAINDISNNDENKICIAEDYRRSGKTKNKHQCRNGVCRRHKSNNNNNNNNNDNNWPLFSFVIVQDSTWTENNARIWNKKSQRVIDSAQIGLTNLL